MSTSAKRGGAKKPGTRVTARQRNEELALHHLEDLVLEAFLNRGLAAKAAEIASAITEIAVGPKLVRRTMLESPRFAQEDRRWNLAVRGLRERPLEGAVEQHIRAYGKPMPLSLLSNEMSLVQKSPLSPEEYERLLPQLMSARKKYFRTADGLWGLNEWLVDIEGQDEEDFLLRNFFMAEKETLDLLDRLSNLSLEGNPKDTALAVRMLDLAKGPLPNRLVGAALWRLRGGKMDPARVFDELRAHDELMLLSGAVWLPASEREDLYRILDHLSREAEKEEIEEELELEALALTETDRQEIRSRIDHEGEPVRAAVLAEMLFELPPTSKSFGLAVQAVNEGLAEDEGVQRVGKQTWALPGQVPDYVHEIPESLFVYEVDPARLADSEADWQLEDGGLEPVLHESVHDPRYEDFGEEDEVELAPESGEALARLSEVRIPVPYNHLKVGTIKVREMDRNLFPPESPLAHATMKPDEGDPFKAWVHQFTTLIYDLVPWYERVGAKPGTVVILKPAQEDDEYVISAAERLDPVLSIEDEEIQLLESMRAEAERVPWSVFEIMRRITEQHRRGISFLRLWARVNVVRRTSRRAVASNLSAYHCFYARPAGSDSWFFDERKLEQGAKKAKRKFART